jgi:hypothetical protein
VGRGRVGLGRAKRGWAAGGVDQLLAEASGGVVCGDGRTRRVGQVAEGCVGGGRAKRKTKQTDTVAFLCILSLSH